MLHLSYCLFINDQRRTVLMTPFLLKMPENSSRYCTLQFSSEWLQTFNDRLRKKLKKLCKTPFLKSIVTIYVTVWFSICYSISAHPQCTQMSSPESVHLRSMHLGRVDCNVGLIQLLWWRSNSMNTYDLQYQPLHRTDDNGIENITIFFEKCGQLALQQYQNHCDSHSKWVQSRF